MGEKYRGWLKDSYGRDMLQGYGLDDLGDSAQEILEELVALPYVPKNDNLRGRLLTKLRREMGISYPDRLRQAIVSLSNFNYNVSVRGGLDPNAVNEGSHPKGLSAPQSWPK